MIHLLCPNPALDRTIITEEFKPNSPIRPIKILENAGGKAFNVAYALKYMQNNDFNIYTILGGKIGEYIEELANEKKYNLKVLKNNVNTRICTINVSKADSKNYLVYEKGLSIDEKTSEEYFNMINENIKEGDIVAFSGSFIPGIKDDFIVRFITQNPNVKIIVDSSGKPLKEAYKAKPYLIKINEEEFCDLFEMPYTDDINKILEILKNKVDMERMIITLGSKGTIAKIKDKYYLVELPKILAVNPIASGDFFLGILINEILKGDMLEGVKKGSAFATANCLREFPEVLQEDFEKFYSEIKVKEL